MKQQSNKTNSQSGISRMKSLFDSIAFIESYLAVFGHRPRGKDKFSIYLNCADNVNIRPNTWFDEFEYRKKYRDVAKAITNGHFLSGFQHWCAHGCSEGRDPIMPVLIPELLAPPLLNLIETQFDKAFYELKSRLRFKTKSEAILHFFSVGAAQSVNPFPPTFFDENFYRLYYRDIDQAIDDKHIPSGIFHFIARGFSEGRSGWNSKSKLISQKLGAAAEMPAFANLLNLQNKISGINVLVDNRCSSRVNIFVPSLDGNIMFGGYTAFLHFAKGLARQGLKLRFVVTEDLYLSKAWCVQTLANTSFAELINSSEFENVSSQNSKLRCSPLDINVGYSTWSTLLANKVSQHLTHKHVLTFIQEYEPIFHPHSSDHFLSNSAYFLPQVSVFNSKSLHRYFTTHKIGHFVQDVNSVCFEHSLGVIAPNENIMKSTSRRRGLLCYARPEAHAARNLFEITVIALRQAVSKGYLDSSWNILGIGCLQEVEPIELGRGCSMPLKSKLNLEDYKKLIHEYDVGISLMWAPHPSVVPFEMAATGLVAVTNTFDNRPSSWFSKFGHNIVAVEPTLDSVVEGIRVAIEKSSAYDLRLLNAKTVKTTAWNDVFNDNLIRKIICMFNEYQPNRVVS